MASPAQKRTETRRGRELALVAHLAAGATQADAAAAIGLSKRTVERRYMLPEFRRKVQRARSRLLDLALGQLADAACEAVTTLRRLLTEAESESVQLGAARAVLDMLVRVREHAELAERMDELEADAEVWADRFEKWRVGERQHATKSAVAS